jgi:hypothetical protein
VKRSSGDPALAVVVPLEDPRGDVVEHLRSWTDHQTLDRDRYQLVAGVDGEHPAFERQVAEILQQQDMIVNVPGGSLMRLYDTAARAARAPVLVLTEAHCHAEPDCLAAVSERFVDPGIDAVMFHHRHGTSGDFGRLSARWFDRCHALWEDDEWIRLKIGGCAIRAEAYAGAGGLDPELELFAPFLLSARVHQQGGHAEHLEEAVITHVMEETMQEDLEHTRSHARGECAAREKHDSQFMERYFGPAGLWERRLGYRPDANRELIAALISATVRSPRDAGWLGRELIARLPAGVAGARPRLAWEAGLAAVHRRLTDSAMLPFERRWRSYLAATEHAVSAVELMQGIGGNDRAGEHAVDGPLGAEDLDEVLIGGFGLEQAEGRRFRWIEPSALIRLAPSAAGRTLRIDTGGLRGAPLDYLRGCQIARRPLPPELISGDEEALEVRLPADPELVADSGLVLLCQPLNGSGDRRRLGMPVVRLELLAAR